jgi:hypothetical protein
MLWTKAIVRVHKAIVVVRVFGYNPDREFERLLGPIPYPQLTAWRNKELLQSFRRL